MIKNAPVHSALQRITVQMVNWHHGDNMVRPLSGLGEQPDLGVQRVRSDTSPGDLHHVTGQVP